jgi:hypothetical protein
MPGDVGIRRRERVPRLWNADTRGMAGMDAERQFRLYRLDQGPPHLSAFHGAVLYRARLVELDSFTR